MALSSSATDSALGGSGGGAAGTRGVKSSVSVRSSGTERV
jgi:hypothetical protein